MKHEILAHIIANDERSNGKCGITLVDIKNAFKIDLNELKNILNELHTENKIKIREGINNKLILKK